MFKVRTLTPTTRNRRFYKSIRNSRLKPVPNKKEVSMAKDKSKKKEKKGKKKKKDKKKKKKK